MSNNDEELGEEILAKLERLYARVCEHLERNRESSSGPRDS